VLMLRPEICEKPPIQLDEIPDVAGSALEPVRILSVNGAPP